MRAFWSIFAVAVCAVVLCGCEAMEDVFDTNLGKYDPKYVISLNTINKYPRGGLSESEVYDFYGKKYTIDVQPVFHSAQIKGIELLPRSDKPNTYDLELTLNPSGARRWMLMCIDHRTDPVAIIIDGVYYGQFQPQPVEDVDFEKVVLVGPFNEVWAMGLQKYAKKNFRHFTPTASSI